MPTRTGSAGANQSLRSDIGAEREPQPVAIKLKPVQTEALAILYAYQKRWTKPQADMMAGYTQNLLSPKSVAGVMKFLWKKGLVERYSSDYGKIYGITEKGMQYLSADDIKKAKDLVD